MTTGMTITSMTTFMMTSLAMIGLTMTTTIPALMMMSRMVAGWMMSSSHQTIMMKIMTGDLMKTGGVPKTVMMTTILTIAMTFKAGATMMTTQGQAVRQEATPIITIIKTKQTIKTKIRTSHWIMTPKGMTSQIKTLQ